MLHLASKALIELLYPLTWSGILIPVLPARLIQALEAPCPYIVGIERRYEKIELPEDDFVLVDLDQDEIESTTKPAPLPKQQRRKLTSLLQVAAPHHNRYGVPSGPPAYAVETYPFDAFSSENPSIFTANAPPSLLAKFVSLNSSSFGDSSSNFAPQPPVFNAFTQSKNDPQRLSERPSTSSTARGSPAESPGLSPTSVSFPPLPTTPVSRNDSGFALQATLREKRSGHFDTSSRRSSSFGFDRVPTLRRPSMPFGGHSSSLSMTTISTDGQSTSNYAPSTYAPSTLAASTIMPNVLMQPVRNTETTSWREGHCLQWRPHEDKTLCSICEDKAEEGIYTCTGCGVSAHGRCAPRICIVCPAAFHPEQIRAAFVRCFASLFYTYRKFLQPASGDQKKAGMLYWFNMSGFLKSVPRENADYVSTLQQTQGKYLLILSAQVSHILESYLVTQHPGFNEFIHERESKSANDPAILLFDQIILSKKNRGRTSFFNKSSTNFLSDTSDHLWRSAAATPPTGRFPGDYRTIITRSRISPVLWSFFSLMELPLKSSYHTTADFVFVPQYLRNLISH